MENVGSQCLHSNMYRVFERSPLPLMLQELSKVLFTFKEASHYFTGS